jgi:hypothetical protein
MQFRSNMVGIARKGQRITPAEPSSIIRADPRGLREGRLHTAPDEPVVAQPSIENNGRRAAPGAVDTHRVPTYQEHLSRRRMVKAIKRGRVEPAAGRYHHCSRCQQQENDTFCDFAPTRICLASERQETPSRKPGNRDPNKHEQGRNLVCKVHGLLPGFLDECVEPEAATLITGCAHRQPW